MSIANLQSVVHCERKTRSLKTSKARAAERAGKLGPATFPAVPAKDHPASAFIAIYDDDETEFLKAVDEFKARTGRRFPLHTDILAIVKSLGYTRPTRPNPCGGCDDPADVI